MNCLYAFNYGLSHTRNNKHVKYFSKYIYIYIYIYRVFQKYLNDKNIPEHADYVAYATTGT